MKTGPAPEIEAPINPPEFMFTEEERANSYRKIASLIVPREFQETPKPNLIVDKLITITSGDKTIGAVGNVFSQLSSVAVELVILYSTPERLELETGEKKLWARGHFTKSPEGWVLNSVSIDRTGPTQMEDQTTPEIGKF